MLPLATNINAAGCRRRHGIGAAALVVGIAAAGVMLWYGVDAGWRVWLLVPFWVAGLGFFQAISGT